MTAPFPGSCPSAPVNTSQVAVSKSSAPSALPNACGFPFLESESADRAGQLELQGQEKSEACAAGAAGSRHCPPFCSILAALKESDGPSHELQMGGAWAQGSPSGDCRTRLESWTLRAYGNWYVMLQCSKYVLCTPRASTLVKVGPNFSQSSEFAATIFSMGNLH